MLFDLIQKPVKQERGSFSVTCSCFYRFLYQHLFFSFSFEVLMYLLVSPSLHSPPTTRACCRLDSGWLWSAPLLPSRSPVLVKTQTPGWDPQWWARSCTYWRSSGRCPWPRCTQWMALHGNPPSRSRETPGTDHRPQRQLLCAAEKISRPLNLYLFYTDSWCCGRKARCITSCLLNIFTL